VPIAYIKRCLLFVTFFNMDIGIYVWKIKAYKDIRACQLVPELVDI